VNTEQLIFILNQEQRKIMEQKIKYTTERKIFAINLNLGMFKNESSEYFVFTHLN